METTIKKILFCTDLSDDSRKVFCHAAAMAHRYNAGIVILHVLEGTSPVEDSMLTNLIGTERLKAIKEKNMDDARGILVGKKRDRAIVGESIDTFCQMAIDGMPESAVPRDTIVIGEGLVSEQILSQTKQQECDLIVMGHSPKSRVAEAVMGSVAREVIRKTRVPVLLVPCRFEEEDKKKSFPEAELHL